MRQERKKEDQSESTTKILIALLGFITAIIVAVAIVVTYRWFGSEKPFNFGAIFLTLFSVFISLSVMASHIRFGRKHYWKKPTNKK